MHSDLVELGWTDDHWGRIVSAVTEEAQKGRVAAQMLPSVGPEDCTSIAVPLYSLDARPRPPVPATAPQRLHVDSDPTLFLTRISVNVYLHGREAADPNLTAALGMFRRAANYIARVEDALVFNGRPGPNLAPPFGFTGIPNVVDVIGQGAPDGLFIAPPGDRTFVSVAANAKPGFALGDQVVTSIIQSINALDGKGQLGPYACALSPNFFEAICTPNSNLVLPRDRILPFLQGPLVRSSAILPNYGVVVALSASPVEIIVASDIDVQFLQTTLEPRLVFRVTERVALRVKETAAIAVLF
jgi:Encapsulating protein for peroxidase